MRHEMRLGISASRAEKNPSERSQRDEGALNNLRTYGQPPFSVAVVHGGPGAAGEMAPVARELASARGVLEPLQTATTLEGQYEELETVLERSAQPPVALIGFSWGAWLSFIVAVRRPELVKKLVLVGSGPFQEQYAAGIEQTRLGRLSEWQRAEAESLIWTLKGSMPGDRSAVLARLGALFSRADAFDPIPDADYPIDCRADIFEAVWKEAAELRRSGELLELGKHIECPVVAIHGDYDPHPAEGVEKPLASVLKDFRFILLDRCGHRPWTERQARDRIFQALRDELR